MKKVAAIVMGATLWQGTAMRIADAESGPSPAQAASLKQTLYTCGVCHGGSGPFPRLTGQHARYLLEQLLVIQSVLRTAPVLHGVIKDLSRTQMNAVATYLQSLWRYPRPAIASEEHHVDNRIADPDQR